VKGDVIVFFDQISLYISWAERYRSSEKSTLDVRVQMIMKQQDQTLGTISGVVDVLREQASLMGQEISEQNVSVIHMAGFLFSGIYIYIYFRRDECVDGFVFPGLLGCWTSWMIRSIIPNPSYPKLIES
jgi:hypothetical protein